MILLLSYMIVKLIDPLFVSDQPTIWFITKPESKQNCANMSLFAAL